MIAVQLAAKFYHDSVQYNSNKLTTTKLIKSTEKPVKKYQFQTLKHVNQQTIPTILLNTKIVTQIIYAIIPVVEMDTATEELVFVQKVSIRLTTVTHNYF